MTKGQIAQVLQMQGGPAEAGAGRLLEQALAAFEEVGDRRQIAVTKSRIADLLECQGQVAEARRLLEQEVLLVYEALGDRRSVAGTKGQIAAILQSQGGLPGALALYLERLTMAREMQDIDTVGHALMHCAQIRLERGDHKRGEIQTIFEELSEAYTISLKLQRPDFIGRAGNLLGQVLIMSGHPDQAVDVLATAATACEKIGHADAAAYCRQLIEQIRGSAS